MAVLLARAYVLQTGLPGIAVAAVERFDDAADISEWALEGVNKALELGLLQGKREGRLDPITNPPAAEQEACKQKSTPAQ
jgi:anti-sigma-K factor RskA